MIALDRKRDHRGTPTGRNIDEMKTHVFIILNYFTFDTIQTK
jgi:hypothetical protein